MKRQPKWTRIRPGLWISHDRLTIIRREREFDGVDENLKTIYANVWNAYNTDFSDAQTREELESAEDDCIPQNYIGSAPTFKAAKRLRI